MKGLLLHKGLNSGKGFGVRLGAKLKLSALTSKMDYWATGLDSDLISLKTEVGTGGSLKQLPGLTINQATSDYVTVNDSSMLMLDGTAIYEFYLETIFDSVTIGNGIIMGSNAFTNGLGWRLLSGSTSWSFQIRDDEGIESFLGDASWVVGLNKIHLKFNLPLKQITININGTEEVISHTQPTVFDAIYNTSIFGFGHGSQTRTQRPAYLKLLKNSVPISEYILGNNVRYGNSEYSWDVITEEFKLRLRNSAARTLQDEINPYKNGYDVYWIEDSLKYREIYPVNAINTSINPLAIQEYILRNDDYPLFKRISPTEIGYHILNYIEMPDLPIFDTSNRTYWKVSTEADEYYVGGTAGKERWFHRTWLDFDWINTHIEDAYKYLLFIQSRWKKAKGQDYVKRKIENIVLFKEAISHYSTRRDIYETEDLGNIYQSTPLFSNTNQRNLGITNGLKVLTIFGNIIKLSIDGGLTYINEFDFSAIAPINTLAYYRVTNNGNVLLFSKGREVYYSDDNLATINAAGVKNLDGTDYAFHVAANASYPGEYFNSLNPLIETGEVLVYGNYGNIGVNGASPTNLYYSIDNGVTWKVFYTFGQNPDCRDDGTASGGTTGTLLGDSNNPIIVRHVHGVNIGYDGNIYISAGETPGAMMKCVYDSNLDTWTVTSLLDDTGMSFTRMRSIGAYEHNGYIYWGSDSTGIFEHEGVTYEGIGLYKCLVSELNDPSKHVLLSTPTEAVTGTNRACLSFVNDPTIGKVLASFTTEIHLSNDFGETWEIFPNKFDFNMIPTFWDDENKWWSSRREVITRYLK